MSTMQFATKQNLRQPNGALILVDDKLEDYVLGGLNPKNLGVAISDGHWAKYFEQMPIEIQRVADGDTFGCAGFADNNIDEALHIHQYGDLDMSDIFTVVGSGTVRGQGNSMKAASEFKRKNGFLLESELPYNNSMTLDQFFAKPSAEKYALAKTKLDTYEFGYLNGRGNNVSAILEDLKISPIKIAVEGNYAMDSNNRLINSTFLYTHAVVLFDFVIENGQVVEWWIYDSEQSQFLKMSPTYKFVAPLIKTLKKSMKNLYRQQGQAAIGLYIPDAGGIVLYRDGQVNGNLMVQGGSIFKAMGWTYDMAQIVDKWPYPILGTFGVEPIAGITFDSLKI